MTRVIRDTFFNAGNWAEVGEIVMFAGRVGIVSGSKPSRNELTTVSRRIIM